MVPNHALPLRHLDRMHLVVPRNLSNRLDAHQGFQSHLGLEGACIPFPFSFAHSSAVLSCPAEPEKSNLATGPNYGVHFYLAVGRFPGAQRQRGTGAGLDRTAGLCAAALLELCVEVDA